MATKSLPSDPLERIGETPALDQNDNQIVLIVGVSAGVVGCLLIVLCIVLLAMKNRKKKVDNGATSTSAAGEGREMNSLERAHSEYASARASFRVTDTSGEYTTMDVIARNSLAAQTNTATESIPRDTALYGDVSQMLAESEARGNCNYGQRPIGKTGDHYGQL